MPIAWTQQAALSSEPRNHLSEVTQRGASRNRSCQSFLSTQPLPNLANLGLTCLSTSYIFFLPHKCGLRPALKNRAGVPMTASPSEQQAPGHDMGQRPGCKPRLAFCKSQYHGVTSLRLAAVNGVKAEWRAFSLGVQ